MDNLIYILDADTKNAQTIKYALSNTNCQCVLFDNAQDYKNAWEHAVPDVVISDVILPDGNGIELMRTFKVNHQDVWYIIISALSDEIDIVRAFEQGADDYLTKPFGVLELVARINAVFRRNNGHRVTTAGEFVIDSEAMTIHYRGQELMLTNKEFRLLRVLIDNAGKVMRRESLLNTVWGYESGATRTLDNHIARLRKAGINVETVFGVGYKLKI